MQKKIAIFCGGPSSEHEVSLNSAATIYKNIDKKKYKVIVCFISKDGNAEIIDDSNINFANLKANKSLFTTLETINDEGYFALLAGIHGEFVENGKLQVLLEHFSIPYSGSGYSASALCMDKLRSMMIVKHIEGIHLPATFIQDIDQYSLPPALSYPIIIKPNDLGSSVGVHIANSDKELAKAFIELQEDHNLKEILLQEYVNSAIEISCGCLEKKDGTFIELPPIEIRPRKSNLFDYASKYETGGSEEITPPVSLSKEVSKKISELTCSIHEILGCKTYSRSDFMVRDGDIYYLETNTLPGMTATSLLPQEAGAAGISFPHLIDFLIENS